MTPTVFHRGPIVAALLAILTLLPSLPSTAAETKDLSSRDMREKIAEYCAEDAAEATKARIVNEFRAEGDRRTQRALETALRDDETRIAVMELIAALRHESMWRMLRDYVSEDADPTDREAAIDAIFTAQDEDGMEEIAEAWADAESDSAFFEALSDGMRRAGLGVGVVEMLLDATTEDEARSEVARQLLAPHLEVAPDAAPTEFAETWDDIEDAYETQAQSFRLNGRNLLFDGTFDTERTTSEGVFADEEQAARAAWLPSDDFLLRRGPNVKLELRQSWMFNSFEPYLAQSFEIRIRFIPLEDSDDVRFGIQSTTESYTAQMFEDEMRIHVRLMRGEVTAPLIIGEWNELVYTITYSNETRYLNATLNGVAFTRPETDGSADEGEADEDGLSDDAKQRRPWGGRGGEGGEGGRGDWRNWRNRGIPLSGESLRLDILAPQQGQTIVGPVELVTTN